MTIEDIFNAIMDENDDFKILLEQKRKVEERDKVLAAIREEEIMDARNRLCEAYLNLMEAVVPDIYDYADEDVMIELLSEDIMDEIVAQIEEGAEKIKAAGKKPTSKQVEEDDDREQVKQMMRDQREEDAKEVQRLRKEYIKIMNRKEPEMRQRRFEIAKEIDKLEERIKFLTL